MKHTIVSMDGSEEIYQDSSTRQHDVQLTPLGIRVISVHTLSATETLQTLYPWQGIWKYSMYGDPMTAPARNGGRTNTN